MKKRQEYLAKMEEALDRLQVKGSLAKLELRETRGELLERYDAVRDKLRDLEDATEDRFEALKEVFESAWHEFKEKYDAALSRRRDQ